MFLWLRSMRFRRRFQTQVRQTCAMKARRRAHRETKRRSGCAPGPGFQPRKRQIRPVRRPPDTGATGCAPRMSPALSIDVEARKPDRDGGRRALGEARCRNLADRRFDRAAAHAARKRVELGEEAGDEKVGRVEVELLGAARPGPAGRISAARFGRPCASPPRRHG